MAVGRKGGGKGVAKKRKKLPPLSSLKGGFFSQTAAWTGKKREERCEACVFSESRGGKKREKKGGEVTSEIKGLDA